MFLRKPGSLANDVELPGLTRVLSWTAVVANAILVIYMIRFGGWLDTASPLLSMITLGGRHRVVLGLAAAGLLLLVGLAPGTGGFVRAGPAQQVLLPVAGVLTLVASAGFLSVAGLGVVVLAVAFLLCRPRPRTKIDVTQRRR